MASFLAGGTYITTAKPYVGMLAEKINNGESIKFKTKSAVVDKKDAEVKKFLAAVKSGNNTSIAKSLKDTKGFKPIFAGFRWTDIEKAPFSGKGGSGAGAEITALTESLQCFYCSLVFNVKKKLLTPKDCTKSNLEKAGAWCSTDRTLEKCLTKGPQDWMDMNVYMKIANKVFSDYKKMGSNIYFHRGSPFMNNLYAAKATVHKNDRASDKPQAPGSFSHDKWNPGDIWASSFSPTETPLSDYTESWGTLNKQVAKLAGAVGSTKPKLLGISLKKTDSPKITKYRDPQSKPANDVKYTGYIFGKNGDFFSSQDMYLHSTKGEMQCRTFGGATSWQGQISGKMAAGGKIGGGNVDFYTLKHFGESIYGNSGAEAPLLATVNKKNETFLKKFYELYKETNAKQMVDVAPVSYQEFSTRVKKETSNFINSKYICVHFAKILLNSTPVKLNKFTNDLWRYASSDTDQSSFYIKVH